MFRRHHFVRHISTQTSSSPSLNGFYRTINKFVNFYEDCVGIAEVHKARSEVTRCEELLHQAQVERRKKQAELKQLQIRLKEIHSELDRTPRGEDKYLYFLTEEHAHIKKEQALSIDFEILENKERDAFNLLSSKVKASHEREREREERMKYWSFSASLIGAFIGVVGSSLGNELRMRRFREMIPTSQEMRPILNEIVQLVHKEQSQVAKFVTDIKEILRYDVVKLHPVDIQKFNGSIENIYQLMKEQNALLSSQLKELKRLIALDKSLNIDSNAVVYVGDEMEALLKKTEDNIQSKMKLQTLVGVVLVYSVVGIVAPLTYFILKKDG